MTFPRAPLRPAFSFRPSPVAPSLMFFRAAPRRVFAGVFTSLAIVTAPLSAQINATDPSSQTDQDRGAPSPSSNVISAEDSAEIESGFATPPEPSRQQPPGPQGEQGQRVQQGPSGFAEDLRSDRSTDGISASSGARHRGAARRASGLGSTPREIDMYVGESRVFPAPNVGRVAVGNSMVMSAVSLDRKEVLVFANQIGTSSLLIWALDGSTQRVKINVVAGETGRIAREVATFVRSIPGARSSVVGDKVIIEGDGLSDLDLAKIDRLAQRYRQVVNFTNPVGWEQMVALDVKIIEFPRNELRQLGLRWAPTGGTAVGAVWSPFHKGQEGNLTIAPGPGTAPITTATAGANTALVPHGLNVLSLINMGLGAQLDALAQNGKAAVLAEPQLSARNGTSASFLAGGEYPYTVSSVSGQSVLFKPFGIKLDILPRVSRDGVIRASVAAEVSAIDPSFSTPAGPGIKSRTTKTEFNVRDGETMVLSGLISRNQASSVDKLPFLGDIPVLGALFRSVRWQNDETELVVFVTPRVVGPQSPGMAQRISATNQRLADMTGPAPHLTNPIQPGVDPASPAVASSAAEVTRQFQVQSRRAELRSTPSDSSAVMANIDAGQVIVGLPLAQRSGWMPVKTPSGQGWMRSTDLGPVH